DTLRSNADWLPANLGVLEPIIKPKGIDDVPIVTFTLYSERPDVGSDTLNRLAHSIEADLKHVAGTREVATTGGAGRAIQVLISPELVASAGVTVADLRNALASANMGMPLGDLLSGNQRVEIVAGDFLSNAQQVAELIVGVHDAKP